MNKFFAPLLALTLILNPFITTLALAQSDGQSAVHAVLFYSPTCPHCHYVIKEVLIPMLEKYGDQLQVIGIDVTQPQGQALYQQAIEYYQIPDQRRGVPTLIVDDIVLVGSGEIPEKLPEIVKSGLKQGGIDWPVIPGFAPEEAATPTPTPPVTQPAAPTASPPEPTATQPEPTPTTVALAAAPSTPAANQPALSLNPDTLAVVETASPPPDPVGMTLATVVTAGMTLALLYAVWRVLKDAPGFFFASQTSLSANTWLVILLSAVGLAVAGYLAYVEITHTKAVCGPVGNCNLVQSSPYARIMGIPVAVLGLINYAAIIGLWVIYKTGDNSLARLSGLVLVGLTIFGVGFSIYLTLLEIFVIRAVCAWCLTSAVVTTALMVLLVHSITTPPHLQRAVLS